MYKIFSVIFICLLIVSCNTHESGKMVFVKGGKFMMGSPDNEPDRDMDEIRRRVTVSSFYIGRFELTQGEFIELMDVNPSNFQGDFLPVENISWFYAIEYCNRLSMKEGLTPVYGYDGTNVVFNRNANGYRLPTEAEWEYASRAGKKTAFNTGKKISSEHANHDNYAGSTIIGGNYRSNSWGIYDMSGNVFEWCWDWYGIYDRNDTVDPQGPEVGQGRVIRGGSWINGQNTLRSAYRNFYPPGSGNERIGFRLARNAQ